jgi:hypothetical protein
MSNGGSGQHPQRRHLGRSTRGVRREGTEPTLSRRGTEGSNLAASSGESTANLTSSHARSRLKDETNYRAASDRADLAASLRRLVAHPTVEQHAQRRDEAERLV